MKGRVSWRASWFLQGSYFLCRGSLALSDRHMILSGWGERKLTRDPGPSGFSSQNSGTRMRKTHCNPLVCGHHTLACASPRRPSFCGVSKPVTLEESNPLGLSAVGSCHLSRVDLSCRNTLCYLNFMCWMKKKLLFFLSRFLSKNRNSSWSWGEIRRPWPSIFLASLLRYLKDPQLCFYDEY